MKHVNEFILPLNKPANSTLNRAFCGIEFSICTRSVQGKIAFFGSSLSEEVSEDLQNQLTKFNIVYGPIHTARWLETVCNSTCQFLRRKYYFLGNYACFSAKFPPKYFLHTQPPPGYLLPKKAQSPQK